MNTKQYKTFKKGYKFPIYPTQEQKNLLERTFGCCRYVYNRGIVDAKQTYIFYQMHKDVIPGLMPPTTSGYSFINKLTLYKQDPESLWLNEVSSVALQQTMMHLGDAFSRFYKMRKGYPSFKKKENCQSFVLTKIGFTLRNDIFFIAKSNEPIKIKFSRKIPSKPSSVIISKTHSGKYYASFICEYNPEPTQGIGQIGIDLGLKDFLVSSSGEHIPNPKPYLKAQRQLKRAQQALSRKRKGSCNRTKARLAVAKCHERISNIRRDFQHKLSRRLVNENQVIGLEKLVVKNMVKNRRLAKSIQDTSWRSFTTMLDYKSAESQNCTLVYMDTWYPSTHICNITKQRLDRRLKLNERQWDCPYCGLSHDRDLNAALNIKDEALLTLKDCNIPDHAGLKVLANTKY